VNIGELLSLPELRADLMRVDEALFEIVASDDDFLTEVAGHLISAGGKRLRPTLAIAAARTAIDGPVPHDVILGGAAVELLHLGSLYHDDVLDEATTRRTVPSVNARWGNFMAIIAGDYLLGRASGIAARLGAEITALAGTTIAELCEGQVGEHRYAYSIERTVEAYEKCISGKTASLIATAARIGALTGGLPRNEVDALTAFARGFGMAFQIRDDILDIVGTDEELGKPAGNDLVEGVYTLPVIFALQEPEAGSELRELLGSPLATPERDKARGIIRNSGGVSAALKVGQEWVRKSTDALEEVRDSDVKQSMYTLASGLFDELSAA